MKVPEQREAPSKFLEQHICTLWEELLGASSWCSVRCLGGFGSAYYSDRWLVGIVSHKRRLRYLGALDLRKFVLHSVAPLYLVQ